MVCPTCLAIRAVLEASGMKYEEAARISHSPAVKRIDKKVVKKVKRKASAYNKKYAAAYRKLKRKHPRMKFASLAKKAHRMVKK